MFFFTALSFEMKETSEKNTMIVEKSSFSYDLPMSTSTGSVHVSSSTFDMEHRYEPPCSAVAWSICKYHNRLYSYPVFIAILPHVKITQPKIKTLAKY